MSSLKEQLAKLGMIEPSDDHQEAPRSWSSPKKPSPNDSKRATSSKGKRKHTPRPSKSTSDYKRPTPLPYRSELSDEERSAEINQLLKRVRMPLPPYGSHRFYYELKNGTIDYIETDQAAFDALSRGKVIIVADPQGKPIRIPREALRELNSIDPNWVPSSR